MHFTADNVAGSMHDSELHFIAGSAEGSVSRQCCAGWVIDTMPMHSIDEARSQWHQQHSSCRQPTSTFMLLPNAYCD